METATKNSGSASKEPRLADAEESPAAGPANRTKTSKQNEKSGGANLSPNRIVFENMNERPVDDINLEFFYKPHTITLLSVSIIGAMCFAFVRYVCNSIMCM